MVFLEDVVLNFRNLGNLGNFRNLGNLGNLVGLETGKHLQ